MKPNWVLVGLATVVTVLAWGCGRDPLLSTTPDWQCPASLNAIGQVGNSPPPDNSPLRPDLCHFSDTSAGFFESMSALVRLVLGRDDPSIVEKFLAQDLDARDADDRTQVITALLTQEAVVELSDAWMSTWLGIPAASPVPGRFDRRLWRDLREQTLRHGRAVFVEASLEVDSLMTSSESFANEVVASHYNFAGPVGTSFERVKLPAERVGVLGHAAVLGSHSTVSRRGMLVQRGFLACEGVPPPSAGVNVHDNLPTTLQPRATFEDEVSEDPACQGCHRLMDVGFALSAFDERGQRRQHDADGAPVDTRAVVMTFMGDVLPVDGLTELARLIDLEASWKTCLAQSLVEVAAARLEEETPHGVADFCSPAAVIAGELEHDVSLAKVLPTLATIFFGGTIDLPGSAELPRTHPDLGPPGCE